MTTSKPKKNHFPAKKLIIITAGVIVLLCLILFGYLYSLWMTPNFSAFKSSSCDTISQPAEKFSLYIHEGDNIDTIVSKLHPCLISAKKFEKTAARSGYKTHIRSGHYVFTEGMSNRQMLQMLHRGLQTPVRICFSVVRTPEQLAGILSRQLMSDSTALITAFRDSARLEAIGFNQQTLPAFFIPDTYEVWWNCSADKLMNRFEQAYNQYWTAERKALVEANRLTPIEAATLASIVQEETNLKSEWPVVAGLYLNRLRKGMPLQADPTIKYTMNDFTIRRIRKEYTEVESPYNTYIHRGLPPGPIGIATKQVLEAVVHAEPNNYIYMCAKEDFSGGHNFATNLTQHNINAMRYHTALTKRRIW